MWPTNKIRWSTEYAEWRGFPIDNIFFFLGAMGELQGKQISLGPGPLARQNKLFLKTRLKGTVVENYIASIINPIHLK